MLNWNQLVITNEKRRNKYKRGMKVPLFFNIVLDKTNQELDEVKDHAASSGVSEPRGSRQICMKHIHLARCLRE